MVLPAQARRFMDVLAIEQVFFLSGCWAAGVEGQKFSLSFGRWISMKFTFCIFLNPGYQPSISTSINFKYLSRCACHLPLMNLQTQVLARKKSLFNPGLFKGTWNLALPSTVPGPLHLALHSVFSTQTPTGCEGLGPFLNFHKPGFASQMPFHVSLPGFAGLAVKILWHRKSEYCNIVGSLQSVWIRLYTRDCGGDYLLE